MPYPGVVEIPQHGVLDLRDIQRSLDPDHLVLVGS